MINEGCHRSAYIFYILVLILFDTLVKATLTSVNARMLMRPRVHEANADASM